MSYTFDGEDLIKRSKERIKQMEMITEEKSKENAPRYKTFKEIEAEMNNRFVETIKKNVDELIPRLLKDKIMMHVDYETREKHIDVIKKAYQEELDKHQDDKYRAVVVDVEFVDEMDFEMTGITPQKYFIEIKLIKKEIPDEVGEDPLVKLSDLQNANE